MVALREGGRRGGAQQVEEGVAHLGEVHVLERGREELAPLGLEAQPDALYRQQSDGTFTDVSAAAGGGGVAYFSFQVVAFDWDGRILVSEWGGGWGATGKGSLHAITHPDSANDPRIAEAKAIAIAGVDDIGVFRLAELLGNDDARIRQMAQFELADRRAVSALEDVARYDARTSPACPPAAPQ